MSIISFFYVAFPISKQTLRKIKELKQFNFFSMESLGKIEIFKKRPPALRDKRHVNFSFVEEKIAFSGDG